MQFFVEHNVSRAANGDTIDVTGDGSFSPTTKQADGEGAFTHRGADGGVKGTGAWDAVALLSFHSFGPATPEQNAAFGLPPGSEGGVAKLRIHVTPDGDGGGFDATLDIICLLGSPPPSAEEGITLVAPAVGLNFNDIVAGDNLFVRG